MQRTIRPVKPYFAQEDIDTAKTYVQEILQSGMLTLSKYTQQFEQAFAQMSKVSHAVAVNSGTSALEIPLRCLGVKQGDEVVVPTNTFSATAASVFFAGGTPVFADIDASTLCISASSIEAKINDGRTKGVVVVHIGGLVCPEMDVIRDLCEKKGLFLLEDAAHAQGSTWDGAPAGSLGDAGGFSFFPTKVITTGEGGMITTNDADLAAKARILRDQGKESSSSERIVELGYNWRMNEIAAALGIIQLKRLDEIIDKRNRIARVYDEAFEGMASLTPIRVPSNAKSNYYKYSVLLSRGIDRDQVKQKLKEKGIFCGSEVYWPPLHLQPIYQKLLGTKPGDFPIAEDVGRRMLCPPINAFMTEDDAALVVRSLADVLRQQ
jgi:perosamine synthetase